MPVIHRELQSSARHSATYHLRIIAAGMLLLATLGFIAKHDFAANLGGKLFGDLHRALFCAMWILVPFLTADCISRERREGTLGILFLTRLNARDIVLAKSLAHCLRALTLWLAVLPLMTLPVLLGGMSWTEAVLSALMTLSALLCALAAGLVASTLSRLWSRVVLYAACLSVFSCMIFVVLNALLFTSWTSGILVPPGGSFADFFQLLLGQGVWFAADWDGSWPVIISRMGLAARDQWLLSAGLLTCGSLLALALAVRLVAWRVSRVWHEEPPGARILWLEQTFCRPVFFVRLFRAWMRAKLERNPVGWLEQRSWSGRLISWGWLGIVTCLYCGFLTGLNFFDNSRQMNEVVTWLLVGSLAMSAAASFRRERETGVLELLLVSPLREGEIVVGRSRGLWGQFLPAMGLALAVWIYLSSLFPYSFSGFIPASGRVRTLEGGAILFFVSSFATLPVIGLYFSLRCRNFIAAFLATLAWGLLVPPLLGSLLAWLWWRWFLGPAYYPWFWWRSIFGAGSSALRVDTSGWTIITQFILAALCWWALLRRLRYRNFPLTVTQ